MMRSSGTASSFSRYWAPVAVLLIATIIIGGIVAWTRYTPGQPIEISAPPPQELQGRIYVDGDVTTPGCYTFAAGDSVGALIQAAGGATDGADLGGLRLYIPGAGEESPSQKIDINRAEVWLLEALPGIGETLAQRIVDYRQENGPFRNTIELLKVTGIGTATYEQIKNLITVAE
ncbi:helix-hairpin-helix domain-containing protein [Chloroflexota bacterium]